ncbi:hypothetical protein E1176_10555, partial [Fulvivirga sp. RKSG066]|uniref:CRTAC1 family protein n=1 Tax=Fulvivirga aurantia TaxID=2529383 RepID=UPI001628C8DE
MSSHIKIFIATVIIVQSCGSIEKETNEREPSNKVFELLTTEKTGIDFSNSLSEDLSNGYNVFDYDYFFNGSGVAIGDLNNDGLNDVVFTANQVNNRIYINQGDFIFEDITEQSGLAEYSGWSNGVVLVDINKDDWLDIYISRGGPDESKRTNLLFINNQNNSFTEKAAEYGLDDNAISTQAAFFDYDSDGDLDCFVMNETPLFGIPPTQLFEMLKDNDELKYKSSSHLYENDNGKFSDVTKAAGLLNPTFGLGLSIADLNDDNLLDIYIANDYYIPDAMYINQGDGTFKDQIKKHTRQVSFYGMGVDIADVNNDLKPDIFVLDMSASSHYRSKTLMASMNTERFNLLVDDLDFVHQYMYNTLQLNMGNNHFRNIAQISGVAKTDWSWAVLMADYNLDGSKDIFVTNGYRRYATDNDTRLKVFYAQRKFKGNVPLEEKKKIYFNMPSEKTSNILYSQENDLKYENVSADWGLETPSFSNGAAYGDLDNDGDLDLVVNNIDQQAFVYKNTTIEKGGHGYLKVETVGNSSESYSRVSIFYEGQSQLVQSMRVRGYRSSVAPEAVFGVGNYNGKIDSVLVQWPGGKVNIMYNVSLNQTIKVNEVDAIERSKSASSENKTETLLVELDKTDVGLDYQHVENNYDDFELEGLLPYKQSKLGPSIEVADVNGDGKEDVIIGGASGQSTHLFIQKSD